MIAPPCRGPRRRGRPAHDGTAACDEHDLLHRAERNCHDFFRRLRRARGTGPALFLRGDSYITEDQSLLWFMLAHEAPKGATRPQRGDWIVNRVKTRESRRPRGSTRRRGSRTQQHLLTDTTAC